MENIDNNKADKIIGLVMSAFVSALGSIAFCGIVYCFAMLASMIGNYIYGVIFVGVFIVLMRFFIQLANGSDEGEDDDEYTRYA